ncbi:ABC transporter ATP-binding protein [Natranaerobius trueperi]|uniref:ABC transporter n=1 Tax=Natranaerobius trueperi TaxID=759412 RepID=A0A226BWE0_9FIRM|nr:ABC transporter ATP-binding protein [Natranaerobius trueperi]OWZ83313.1 ABC transporter [Natranaerobius trueperi]
MKYNKQPLIEVNNLTKKFGDFKAADNICFYIESGETFGFLGPNGAGKSSTINMLTGLSRITSGEYFVLGNDFEKNHKELKKIIGVVPDESNMYDELTGFENLFFTGSLYGIDKRTRADRAKQLLKKFNLSEVKNKLFRYYSKGMKRKLTIAAALMHQPKILFLDEPTTGIDIQSARDIRSLIKQLNYDGKTVFLTTHYIEEAERLCERIAFIVNGQIVKIDKTNKLLIDENKGKTIEFVVDKVTPGIEKQIKEQFNVKLVNIKSKSYVVIESEDFTTIFPYIEFFNKLKINVLEAKVLKLSLEDVFVRMTGIESNFLKTEKGESTHD